MTKKAVFKLLNYCQAFAVKLLSGNFQVVLNSKNPSQSWIALNVSDLILYFPLINWHSFTDTCIDFFVNNVFTVLLLKMQKYMYIVPLNFFDYKSQINSVISGP